MEALVRDPTFCSLLLIAATLSAGCLGPDEARGIDQGDDFVAGTLPERSPSWGADSDDIDPRDGRPGFHSDSDDPSDLDSEEPVESDPAESTQEPLAPEGAKRMFLTSETYTGDLRLPFADTGTEGASYLCNMHAELSGLGGTWTAWISDGDNTVMSRLEDVSPWYLTDGRTVAISSMTRLFIHGLDNPVDRDEYGRYILRDQRRFWSATNRYGEAVSQHCNGWSSSGWGVSGRVGSMDPSEIATPEGWTVNRAMRCEARLRLLCIEQ